MFRKSLHFWCGGPVVIGHRPTLNGYGVMMNNTAYDPFVAGWIRTASQLQPRGEAALEIGPAFGVATLEALEAGAPYIVASDIEQGHLDYIKQRWSNTQGNAHYDDQGQPIRQQLEIWCGRVPSDFLTQEGEAKAALLFRDRKLKATLIANVLHFLTPEEIAATLAWLYRHTSPGGKVYISLDSPWTATYKPLWPLYYYRKNIVKSPHPGFHRIRQAEGAFFRSLTSRLIPHRLRAIDVYHPMEPEQLQRMVETAGFRVAADRPAIYFAGDISGNPSGVSLNAQEMVGVVGERVE